MIIAYNILPQEQDEFFTGFIKRLVIPPDEFGNPAFTPEQWLHEAGRRFFQGYYEQGARQIAHENAHVLSSIIKVGSGPP